MIASGGLILSLIPISHLPFSLLIFMDCAIPHLERCKWLRGFDAMIIPNNTNFLGSDMSNIKKKNLFIGKKTLTIQ